MSDNSASAKAKEMEKASGTKDEGKARAEAGERSFNMDELRELSELVNENGFTDFEFENENIRVRMSKMPAAPIAAAQPYFAAPPPATGPVPAASPVEADPVESAPAEDLYQITSPIVGTFYRAAGPDKEPYVKEGSKVGPSTIVCIVEAMKLMNEIEAETEGEVAKIYVENGQPVEYGQPLFGIRK